MQCWVYNHLDMQHWESCHGDIVQLCQIFPVIEYKYNYITFLSFDYNLWEFYKQLQLARKCMTWYGVAWVCV